MPARRRFLISCAASKNRSKLTWKVPTATTSNPFATGQFVSGARYLVYMSVTHRNLAPEIGPTF